MTNIALYESIAKVITAVIVADEKHVFDGRGLDTMARGLSTLRFHVMKAMMETGESRSKARYLFEDFDLADAAQECMSQWVDDWTAGLSKPVLLISKANISRWRKHPHYERFKAVLPGVEMSIVSIDTEIVRNGETYAMMMFEPDFPEWYIFTLGPHAFSDAVRIDLMENIAGQVVDLMPPNKRISSEKINQMYFYFVRDVVSQLQKAAGSSEDARKIFTTWFGMYNLCGLELSAETVHDLPPFYKEFSIMLCDTIFETSQLPYLQAMVRENT